MSSPSTTTDGSWPSLMSIAALSAWIMFICAMASVPRRLVAHLGRLAAEVFRHFLEHVLEHEARIEPRWIGERAVADRLLPRSRDVLLELDGELLVALLGPFAEADEVVLEPLHGVAERELLVVIFGPVARGVVARRVRRGTIGHVLDERRSAPGARALGRPLGDRMHREAVVAVHAHAGDSVAGTARSECRSLAARVALKGRYGPLVVDDAQNRGRLVDRGEEQRMVEISLGARAFADPAHGDVVLPLDRGRHGPADRLRELRREVAGDGEDVAVTPVVHDRQLAALAHVARVRKQLAHQVQDRPSA